MLRRPPINLNVQSQNATISLIREVLAAGLDITEVRDLFFHTSPQCLGQAIPIDLCRCSWSFRTVPRIPLGTLPRNLYNCSTVRHRPRGIISMNSHTECRKADSTFPIVSAASIAAKVTRDAWMDGWVFEEAANIKGDMPPPAWLSAPRGSGYPSGKCQCIRFSSFIRFFTSTWRPKYSGLVEGLFGTHFRISQFGALQLGHS